MEKLPRRGKKQAVQVVAKRERVGREEKMKKKTGRSEEEDEEEE